MYKNRVRTLLNCLNLLKQCSIGWCVSIKYTTMFKYSLLLNSIGVGFHEH